ncbi:Hint domain-containing protein [Roseobacter sp.]|uniref:Hint domain-containing protein n=1 Tax=Roseobacter sp. TaxID=1907202 RepID=UPI00329709D3
MLTGTQVVSRQGWRPVETLVVGDMVQTFDNGFQAVARITKRCLWENPANVASRDWPVVVPSGVLGNRAALTVLPDQGVLLEHDAISDPMGDCFGIVPGAALDGVCGMARCKPTDPAEVIIIEFANEEVIFSEGGLMVRCPSCGRFSPAETLYNAIPLADARTLVATATNVSDSLSRAAKYVTSPKFGATTL